MPAALRFLNVQGIVGLAAALILIGFLAVQKGETRHWHKSSDRFERLYRDTDAALTKTVDGYRAAAELAAEKDRANAARVAGEAKIQNERTSHDFETRLAAARADHARRLRSRPTSSATDPGGGEGAAMPGVPAAAGGSSQTAGQDGLSDAERLIATEQAIQLDELIKWVKAIAGIDVNGADKGNVNAK